MSSITPSKVTSFLMFTGRAEDALAFYAGRVAEAGCVVIERYGPEGPGAEGSVMHARLRIGDQAFMAFDSPPVHAFDFTPSLSLFVSCESEEEIDRLFAGLSEGGFVMMPLSTEYGFSAKYAWLSDRFGVSWQLSLRLGFGGGR